MSNANKTREQLIEELTAAQKRIAGLEAADAAGASLPQLNKAVFESFVDSATDSFSMWDSSLDLIYINNATLKYHPSGTVKSDVIGKNMKELIPNAEKSGRIEKYRGVLETGEPLLLEDFKADPKYGDIYLSIKVFKINGGIGIISHDITERKRMEKALSESEGKYKKLAETTNDIFYSIDWAGNFTFIGPQVARYGLDQAKMLGMNFLEFIHPEDREKMALDFGRSLDNVEEFPSEFRIVGAGGDEHWLEDLGSIQRDSSGAVTGINGVLRDITERKRAEEALRQSEERYRRLAENTPAMICTFLPDSTLTYVNTAYCKYFDRDYKELVGQRFLEFLPDDNERLKVKKQYISLTPDNPARTHEHVATAPGGRKRWQQWTNQAFFNDEGEIIVLQSIGFDITERKKAEEALNESEEKFRIIFNTIADGISVIDLTTGELIDTNEAALRMFNFEREDVIGMPAFELFAEKDRQRAIEDSINTLCTGDSGLGEWCLLGKGGSEHDCEARASIIYDGEGKPKYMVNVMRDITEHKRIQEELQQSRERLRRIFDSIGDAVTIVDLQGIIQDANETALHMTGYSREEHTGRNGIHMLAERDRPRAIEKMMETLINGHGAIEEFSVLRKDGSEFPAETITNIIQDASGSTVGFVNILRDITERKLVEAELNQYRENLENMVAKRTSQLEKANLKLQQEILERKKTQEALKSSEEKLRTMFASMADGVVVTDLEGNIKEANTALLQMFGYEVKEEVLGLNGFEFIIDKDRNAAINDRPDLLKKGVITDRYWTLIDRHGKEFEAELSATLLKDMSGNPTDIMVVLRNVTERKRMEAALKESEEKLRTMFSSMADGVVVTDLRGNFKDANEALLRMFGGDKKEDVIGQNGFDFISAKDRDRAMDDMKQLLSKGLITGKSWTFKHISGREFEAELSIALLKDANDNPTDILIVMRDVTERKRMEEALRLSEEKLRTIFESIEDSITLTDMSGNILDINKAGIKLGRFKHKDEALGRKGLDFIAETDRPRAIKDIGQVAKTGRGISAGYKLVDKTGNVLDIEVTGVLLHDISGIPVAILNVIRDVTERKRMEEALKESEIKYRTLVEQSSQGIAIIQDGRIVFANNALSKINGYTPEEMYALSTDEILKTVHKDDHDRVRTRMIKRPQGVNFPRKNDVRVMRKDGTERWIESYAKRILYQGRTATQSTFVDITERKLWEEEIHRSREELSFYLRQLTRAQEEERRRIARELHDDTIQEIIALSRQLNDLIDKDLEPGEDRRENRKSLLESQRKVDDILNGIRRFTRDLRPSILDDLGLIPALEALVSEMYQQHDIPIHLSIGGDARRINPEAELALFRISQEALRNACYHSGASAIQLSAQFTKKKINIKVSDNGKGFAPPQSIASLTRHGKLGLAGMQERAQLIGAELSIESKDGTGTKINLELKV